MTTKTTTNGFELTFENDKLFIHGFFDVTSKLFKDLTNLGDYRDYNDTCYTRTFEIEDGKVKEDEPYYGRFLFCIENTKTMRFQEFLDRTGTSSDKMLDGDKTLAEWLIITYNR